MRERGQFALSYYFQYGEHVLWNPAYITANMLMRVVEFMEERMKCKSGLHPNQADEIFVDFDQLTEFIPQLALWATNGEPYDRRFIQAVVEPCLALLLCRGELPLKVQFFPVEWIEAARELNRRSMHAVPAAEK